MSNEVTLFREFESEITARQEELLAILPPHIPAKSFGTVALIAAKNNPDLLFADRRSLHAAITQAAEDGIMPDGREGMITIFNSKVKIDGKEVWIKKAQYTPILFGIRKRAIEICGMTIDAQVVHANDKFIWHQGDDPRIEHTPAPLGSPRGNPIGAYAIFKADGEIKHREVMDVDQISKVREQSRNKDGLMWVKFWTEAWRKTVIRRGIKTVPSVQELERIIKRDDQDFDFGPKPKASALTSTDAPKIGSQQIGEIAEAEVIDGPREDRAPDRQAKSHNGEAQQEAPKDTAQGNGVLAQFQKVLKAALSTQALNDAWGMFDKKLTGADRDQAMALFEAAYENMGVQA